MEKNNIQELREMLSLISAVTVNGEFQGGKVQKLNAKAVVAFGFALKFDGSHVSILPPNDDHNIKLKEWSNTRPSLIDGFVMQFQSSPFTKALVATRVDELKYVKPKE